MRSQQENLLEKLIRISSPSGFEEEIASCIERELLQYLPRNDVYIDGQKNVVAVIQGSSDEVVMLDAHNDLIGFIVSNIGKDGLISLQAIGGQDSSIMSARDLVILTDSGKVNAVVDRKPTHLVNDEVDENINVVNEAEVDVGIRKRKKVQSIIKIGDPVVYKSAYNKLCEDYRSGYGFDDRVGCFILIEVIKLLSKLKKKLYPTLVFTFSSQEETSGKKCRPLIKKYNPSLFVEVDVTFATDYGLDEEMEKMVGLCQLGNGVVIYRGVDICRDGADALSQVAKTNKIKVQYQAVAESIGYTATEVTHEGNGIKALILGIPLRNMHTPVEIVSLKDLTCGIQLLVKFLTGKKIVDLL